MTGLPYASFFQMEQKSEYAWPWARIDIYFMGFKARFSLFDSEIANSEGCLRKRTKMSLRPLGIFGWSGWCLWLRSEMLHLKWHKVKVN